MESRINTQMKLNDLVLAQVTDMHIGASNAKYRGIDVRQQFINVLQRLAKKPLDLLVLSCDLAAVEGEPEAYTWIRRVLTTFPYPYVIMAGNHDHVWRMLSAFDLPNTDVSLGKRYFSRLIKGRRLLFLDSASYRVTKQQLEWLSGQLVESKNKNPKSKIQEQVLLFIHHPPLKCECQFMDEHHALQNLDDVWQVLEQFPQIKPIFCGHYHAEKTVIKNDKFVHLTPSTAFQIDTETADFSILHTKPGWRLIEWQGTQVHTYVEYL